MQKRIFNSVGSNYTYRFAIDALFARGTGATEKLTEYLNKRYNGKTTLFYKGREAITYALLSCGLPEQSKVAICAYTCAVVPTAVKNAKLVPLYVDIDSNHLDFSFEAFKKVYENDSTIRAVIIQNTLGFTQSITEIEAFCKEKGIFLIEDLAHSAGATYPCGRETGTVGDFTILSFSQDKIVDAISGGALVTRTSKAHSVQIDWRVIPKKEQRRDRLYPIRTCKIRSLYSVFGIGKLLHFILKKRKALSLPVYALDNKIEQLPSWYAELALHRFHTLDTDIARRRKIAEKYLEAFPALVHTCMTKESILRATCVRIPLLVDDRATMIACLQKKGIHISDIWYDVPVSPLRYWHLFKDENKAGEALRVSEKMINLPTHMTLSDADVQRIICTVNTCKN